jgi:GNAT superfamily N-acetyltransferase
MNLRLALPSDCESIAALHAASWRHAYRGALSDKYLSGDIMSDRLALWDSRLHRPTESQYVVVACEDSELLGFACANADDDPTWGSLLDNIHVAQAAHRRGIGRQLFNAVVLHCSTISPDAGLYLWVLQNNTNAQNFYYSHGAKNVGTDVWDAPGGTKVPRFRFAWTKSNFPWSTVANSTLNPDSQQRHAAPRQVLRAG